MVSPQYRKTNSLSSINTSVKVQTGLGDVIDQYVALSPTLTQQIKELKSKNWTFEWNISGGGSVTAFGKEYSPGKVLIDGQFNPGDNADLTDMYTLMKVKYVVSTLAHEVGHALIAIQFDTSSLEACLHSGLSGPGSEAAATYNNIIVRQEIIKNSIKKEDIVKNGKENIENMNLYQKIIKENNKQDALNKIADMYLPLHPSNRPDLTYKEYYTEHCKKIIKKR